MSEKYHISPKTGRPNKCTARGDCPLKQDGETVPHFTSKTEALEASQKMLESVYDTIPVTKKRNTGEGSKAEDKAAEKQKALELKAFTKAKKKLAKAFVTAASTKTGSGLRTGGVNALDRAMRELSEVDPYVKERYLEDQKYFNVAVASWESANDRKLAKEKVAALATEVGIHLIKEGLRRGEVLPEVTDVEKATFTGGGCVDFANVMANVTGWERRYFRSTASGAATLHTFCVDQDGKVADARGVGQDFETVWSKWHKTQPRVMDSESFENNPLKNKVEVACSTLVGGGKGEWPKQVWSDTFTTVQKVLQASGWRPEED